MPLTDYEHDYMLDSGPHVNRLETIRQSLPKAVTNGPTIVIDGVPQFKASPDAGIEYQSGSDALEQAIAESGSVPSDDRLEESQLRKIIRDVVREELSDFIREFVRESGTKAGAE